MTTAEEVYRLKAIAHAMDNYLAMDIVGEKVTKEDYGKENDQNHQEN